LRTESPVNIYDIEDPYDLRRLDEMLPLKTSTTYQGAAGGFGGGQGEDARIERSSAST
jgi:hypothetical protein